MAKFKTLYIPMSKNEDGHCFFLESTKTKQHSPLQKAPGHAIRLLVARAPHFTPAANPSTEPWKKT